MLAPEESWTGLTCGRGGEGVGGVAVREFRALGYLSSFIFFSSAFSAGSAGGVVQYGVRRVVIYSHLLTRSTHI